MAIAFGTSGAGVQSGNSTAVTVPLTIPSGTTLLLVAVHINEGADKLNTVNWNTSETLTQIAAVNGGAGGMYLEILGLLNPTPGSFNVVATKTSTCSMDVLCATYSGTDDSTLPSITDTDSLLASSAATISAAVTTVEDNAWVAGSGGNNYINGMTVDAGHVIRVDNVDGSSRAWADTDGPISPAGLDTMTFSAGAGTGDWVEAICVINPGASTTNIKTWDGVARANVKTLMGVASANIKTINGIT